MDTLGISVFEVGVGVSVVVILATVWLVNRKRAIDSRRTIKVDTGFLAAFVTLVGVALVAIWRSHLFTDQPLPAVILIVLLGNTGLVVWDLLNDLHSSRQVEILAMRFREEVAGLGNIHFFPTKEETFRHLNQITVNAREKLMATRFSPGDISQENEYFQSVRKQAFNPDVLSIRIHCLAHRSKSAIEGVCHVIEDLTGASNFRLGIAFFNNSFEIVLADDATCVFCFHDLEMTVKNGFQVDCSQPCNRDVVANMGLTFRNMLEACYIVVDFERFVRSPADAKRLSGHLRRMHNDFCQGHVPTPIPLHEIEDYLATRVFAGKAEARQAVPGTR